MEIAKVADEQDTSWLWKALLEAKAENDFKLVRAIEGRMRDISAERRFSHLSDEELRRQIDGTTGNREPTGMLGHSPGSHRGSDVRDGARTSVFNEAHRRDQHANIEATRSALLGEWDRRQASS